VASQVALTYAASLIAGLAAQQAGRPDLIRSPKRVLAHLCERDSALSNALSPTGLTISHDEVVALYLPKVSFHGAGNSTIKPQNTYAW
jgi:hypothetical protein